MSEDASSTTTTSYGDVFIMEWAVNGSGNYQDYFYGRDQMTPQLLKIC